MSYFKEDVTNMDLCDLEWLLDTKYKIFDSSHAVKLKIEHVEGGHLYHLTEAETGRKHELSISFYNGEPPTVGDTLVLSEKILRENKRYRYLFCFSLTFSPDDGRAPELLGRGQIGESDVAILVSKQGNIVMKRQYGLALRRSALHTPKRKHFYRIMIWNRNIYAVHPTTG